MESLTWQRQTCDHGLIESLLCSLTADNQPTGGALAGQQTVSGWYNIYALLIYT